MPRTIDPTSLAGKDFAIDQHVQVLVVGAGPAGLSAANEAARLGLQVMLVDEHPVASALIGLDIPYLFGERLDPAVQNKPRMLERVVAARPELETSFELGVDVRLGVYVWGAFVEGPTSRALPHRLIGLADEERSWLVSFDRIIVAAGARDLALAFPGWDRPGVVGAQGAAAAMRLYQAFSARRVVVLGAGALGLQTALQAQAAGLQVAGIVDLASPQQGEALDAVRAHDIPIHAGHAVRGTLGGIELQGVRIAPLAAQDAAFDIACDTLIFALDLVPNVELFDLLGCAVSWRPELGGFVPDLDAEGRLSVPGIYAAGDCTGITSSVIADATLGEIAGRCAARAAARDAGIDVEALPPAIHPASLPDRDAARRHWLQSHAPQSGDDVMICRCEEVGLRDLLGVRPPRYLSYKPTSFEHRDLRTLAADGPINQDQIKRLTRAGMGACQGRRCREQVQILLAMQGNQPTGSVPLPSYRAPLRPLPLNVLSAHDETTEMRDNWVVWFGISSQWLPQWEPVPDVIDPRDDRRVLRDFEA
ncbi:MAG TPA: FAD-dependent oxidoreductase [Acetobacteraceae bacterium]|nr:FAD-dependent oxidoreductase [Acetobacteraceae bacterium]